MSQASSETGPKPNAMKVKTAPASVPFVLLASATAIMSATYNQPTMTRIKYMV
jgi:hypothetical protein